MINDSKSTTVAATQAALTAIADNFPGREITLMIGGQAKAGSWSPLMDQLVRVTKQAKNVVCFGQDGNLLLNHCRAAGVSARLAKDVADGLSSALACTSAQGVILFSPGCASFDEFSNFEQRGERFRKLVELRRSVARSTTLL